MTIFFSCQHVTAFFVYVKIIITFGLSTFQIFLSIWPWSRPSKFYRTWELSWLMCYLPRVFTFIHSRFRYVWIFSSYPFVREHDFCFSRRYDRTLDDGHYCIDYNIIEQITRLWIVIPNWRKLHHLLVLRKTWKRTNIRFPSNWSVVCFIIF